MPLDAAIGTATSNSYATLAEFEEYAAARVPVLSWFATATDPQKEAALMAGARELDACFDWTGTAVDAVQALCWPRSGMTSRNGFGIGTTTIPAQLKNAQCEFALQLGAGDRLGDNDPLKKGVTSIKAGSVALSFSDVKGKATNYEDSQASLRLQQSDLNYVSNVVPDEVRRLLVASWFNQADINQPLVFCAI